MQPCNKDLNYPKGSLPISEKIASEIISLPMYPELSNEMVIKITKYIIKFLMKQNSEFPYIIGCDCDPDRISFNNNISSESLTWDGISKGIKNFIDKRKIFNEEYNIKFNMTWFVRSDLQIKHFHQNASYCLEKFNDIWQKLVVEGDEIAWHLIYGIEILMIMNGIKTQTMRIL